MTMNIIGNKIIKLDVISSTNDFAEQLLSHTKQQEGTIVLAAFQTDGKGQGQNRWFSEKGKNILMSTILYPNFIHASNQFFLNAVISLSIFKTVKHFLSGSPSVSIKWPNDIYIKNEKIAGILIKNSLSGNKIKYSIAGTGININQREFPPFLNACSLASVTGKETNIESFLSFLIDQMNIYYKKLKNLEFISLKNEYTSCLYGLHEERYFLTGEHTTVKGIITGITDSGKLAIKTNDKVQTYMHGEIQILL